MQPLAGCGAAAVRWASEPWEAGMRRIGMRRSSLLLLAPALVLVAGCSGPAGSAAGQAPPSTGPAGASSTPGAAMSPPASHPAGTAPAAHPVSHAAGPPTARPASPATAAPTPAADPEQGRDLRGAPVVLTGTVSVRGGCRTMQVHGNRWVLLGAPARALADGQRVTVRGRPAPVPDGCDAAFA